MNIGIMERVLSVEPTHVRFCIYLVDNDRDEADCFVGHAYANVRIVGRKPKASLAGCYGMAMNKNIQKEIIKRLER